MSSIRHENVNEKIQIIETTFYYEFDKKEIKSLKNLNSLFPAKALKLEPKITGKKLGKNIYKLTIKSKPEYYHWLKYLILKIENMK